MNNILNYLIVLVILAILRTLLPRVKAVKSLLITRTVEAMERKIQGSRRGEEKKARAIRILRWWGVKTDETTSAMIDLAVDAMNARNSIIKSDLKESVTERLNAGVDSAGAAIKNKFNGEDK
jgi:hypothetical protein